MTCIVESKNWIPNLELSIDEINETHEVGEEPNSAETTNATIHFEGLGWRVGQISNLDWNYQSYHPKIKGIFGKKFESDPNSAETTKTTIHFEGLGLRVSQISNLDWNY